MLRGQRGKTSKEQRRELEQGETPARKSKPIPNTANFEALWCLSFPAGAQIPLVSAGCCCDPTDSGRPFLTLAHCIPPGAATKPSQVCCWFSLKLQSSSQQPFCATPQSPALPQILAKKARDSSAREVPAAPCSAGRLLPLDFHPTRTCRL